MHAPMFVAPSAFIPPEPPPGSVEVADLLKQLIDVQKEQLAIQRAQQASQDAPSRWRAFLARWANDFPGIASDCKQVLPYLERSYLSMIREMIDRLKSDDGSDLENDYTLSEFLDRYGMRIGQLGNIIGQIGPLAEAAPIDAPPAT